MTAETFVISDRSKQEKLVPVLTYVPGLSRPKAIAAWLSFLSVCHDGCSKKTRLPDILSAEDETQCLRLLDAIIDNYVKVNFLPPAIQAELCETARKITDRMSVEHSDFIKDRLSAICGDHVCRKYWKKFETTSCLGSASDHNSGILSALQLKKFSDFASVIIALCALYGCRDDFYERMVALEQTMRLKYGTGFPDDRFCLYLWPLDFSFAQDGPETCDSRNEHRALFKAVQSINSDARVQVCTDSLLWSRDKIAWVSDDYDAFVEPSGGGTSGGARFGCGLLYEGGNIITGTAIDNFVLVAQGPFSDSMEEITFRYEMDKRNIQTYVLPDGFLWSFNPQTGKNCILDSIHIDAVINFISSQYTCDGRPKLIIDPYYRSLIEGSPDFKRFLDQQSIADTDVIVVDDRELYLNLPNFSVMPDQDGKKMFLFNKDKGFTLPRLNLKPGLLVQPDIEITAMASSFGSIRCATNMLPESYVIDKGSVEIVVSDTMPSKTRKLLADLFNDTKHIVDPLASLFVSRLVVQPGQNSIQWEFDEFSRTAYLYCTPDQASDPEICRRMVLDRIPAIAGSLSRELEAQGF